MRSRASVRSDIADIVSALDRLNATRVTDLRRAVDVDELAAVEKLARRLRLAIASDPRDCEWCGGPVVGRSDARYCGTTCRVSAHRERHATTDED